MKLFGDRVDGPPPGTESRCSRVSGLHDGSRGVCSESRRQGIAVRRAEPSIPAASGLWILGAQGESQACQARLAVHAPREGEASGLSLIRVICIGGKAAAGSPAKIVKYLRAAGVVHESAESAHVEGSIARVGNLRRIELLTGEKVERLARLVVAKLTQAQAGAIFAGDCWRSSFSGER